MEALEWLSDAECRVGSVTIQCMIGDYSLLSTADRFVLLKDRSSLEQYASALEGIFPRNLLEFGIFQGGSAVLYTLWFGLEKFVGVDICKPVEPLEQFRQQHAAGDRIRTHYGTSQTDADRVRAIAVQEFNGEPIDLIIDDASHLYRFTRRTFEIAFPLLRPGGIYVIEDWGWAHWEGSKHFEGETALSMLIMELTMLCASRPDLISEIRLFPAFAFIRKAERAPPMAELDLSAAINRRGIHLSGEQDLNLGGIGGLIADRIKNKVQRKLERRKRRRLARAKRRN
jgi:SAM-dependent methyltransferase